MPTGFVLWFTGLSGSGKSTLTSLVAAELRRRSVHVETLDGDEVRRHLSKGLGFSREDRDENIRRIGFVAKLIARSGGCAIAAAISPYRDVRREVRRSCERFVEIYTECPVHVLAERDPKGLYKKALRGEIRNFTGVDDPYEAPEAPEVHVHTDRQSPEESLRAILAKLEELELIPRWGKLLESGSDDSGGPRLPPPHGHELVDGIVHGERAAEEARAAAALPSVTLRADDAGAFLALVTGLFSPLNGFMTSKDFVRVTKEMRLESGLPWAAPITLEVPAAVAAEARTRGRLGLRDQEGHVLGTVDAEDVWQAEGSAATYVGGKARSFDLDRARAAAGASGEAWLAPAEARTRMEGNAWQRMVAILTCEVPTLPSEHVVRAALEFADGALILVSEDRAGAEGTRRAVGLEARVRAWQAVASRYFPSTKVLVTTHFPFAPVSGRQRALHDALLAKTYGASRVLVAHLRGERELLTAAAECYLPGELGIQLLLAARGAMSDRVGACTVHTAPEGDGAVDLAAAIENVRTGGATSLFRPETAVIIRAALAGNTA